MFDKKIFVIMRLNGIALPILFLLIPFCLKARNKELSVDNIDVSLIKHANAVVRNYELEITILSKTEVEVREHYAITILNEKGARHGRLSEDHSSLEKIEKLSGHIYDKTGKEIKKLLAEDFTSRPAVMSYAYYDDSRVREYTHPTKQFPYTIEYDIVKRQSHTFYIPPFLPQFGHDCSIEKALLTVVAPVGMELRYKRFRIDNDQSVINGGDNVHTWQVKNVEAYEKEPLEIRTDPYNCGIFIACKDFMLDKYTGSADNWLSYGKFDYELNKGRDVLPANIKQKVAEISSNAKGTLEKIRLLYKYLQDNYRYVAIEYGVSGWQTLDATHVATNKYGDCKGLTNYMMALLNEAGIQSYPVLIASGSDEPLTFLKDFSFTQFNHVILSIPLERDTLWLECTSNELPVNFLSSFTDDRYGLMITPEGGILIRTPLYDTLSNVVARHTTVIIAGNDLQVKMDNIYKNEPANDVYRIVHNAPKTEIDNYINAKFNLSNYNVTEYDYKRIDSGYSLLIAEKATMLTKNMFSKTGQFYFLKFDVLPLDIPSYPELSERKYSFAVPFSICISDTFEIDIPTNFAVGSLPDAVFFSHSFGSYTCNFTTTANKIIVTRRLIQNKGTYPPGQYNEYVKWLDKIQEEKSKRILLKDA